MDFSALKTFPLHSFIPMHGEKNVVRGLWAAQKELGAGVDGC